jgi:hypothetical protein
MARKSTTGLQPSRRLVLLVFGALAFWILAVFTGLRLPYVYTSLAFLLRVFVMFPLMLSGLTYLCFIYRKPNQLTGYKQAMNNLPVGKERVKATAWGLLGLVLIPGTLAWTSIAFPAWATQLFASERYAHVFQINDITVRSGAKWSTVFDLELTDASGEKVMLRLSRSRYEMNRWRSGEDICVIGRAWMFGAIVDGTSRDLDRCRPESTG